MRKILLPTVTLFAMLCYWAILGSLKPVSMIQEEVMPTVVLSAPIQVLLYAGDRFMAANFETIRASAALTTGGTQDFRLRSHRAASLLNSCHEDNYWFGNASLSWGGAVEQGMGVLKNASQCRYWDEWPLFFYGFNQNFFYQDVAEAQRALKIAAGRSEKNKAAFQTYAMMLGLNQVKNTRMALKILEAERSQAHDKNLKKMLDDRVTRLQGLLTLREAQAEYEKKYGRELEEPQDLLELGFLTEVPQDPLKLGYEFKNKNFQLRQLRVR